MTRVLIVVGTVALGVAVWFYLVFSGPHMQQQPHIRAFQWKAPQPSAGSVPLTTPISIPTATEVATMVNPVSMSDSTVNRGQIYYGYYCEFCHASDGSGNSPVGISYMPAPTDLRSAAVQTRADGEILRAMLVGTGHEPVLARVVPPEHRWYVVNFVRSLHKSADLSNHR